MRCRWACWLIASSLVASCAPRATPPRAQAPRPAAPPASAAPWDAQVKVGKPYEVLGRWYHPRDARDYDETGLASWYGPGFHAKSTANGEVFDQEAVSAAHKTLPMPSYVEVENLENGRKLTVRVNDRGPFVDGRIIDLSRRSADLLGVWRAGTARVRVRRIDPTPEQVAALRPAAQPFALAAAPPPPAATARPVAAAPVVTVSDDRVESVAVPGSAPVQAAGPLIQVAAVADAGRATWLAGYLSQFGPTRVERTASGLHRVRIGPFETVDKARVALERVRRAGYEEAWLLGAPPAVG